MYDQARAQQPPDRPDTDSRRRSSAPVPLLLSSAERDEITLRLRNALHAFAKTPRQALEEAESSFDEATDRLMNALAERRRHLRACWQDQDSASPSPPGSPAEAGAGVPSASPSDELQLVMRQYRDITQRLLHL
jgi:hypothetical protein